MKSYCNVNGAYLECSDADCGHRDGPYSEDVLKSCPGGCGTTVHVEDSHCDSCTAYDVTEERRLQDEVARLEVLAFGRVR